MAVANLIFDVEIPEKSIHSSPLRASGTPRTIKSRVFLVKNILVPRPYSEKWMFQDCSFIFSLSCQTHIYSTVTVKAASLFMSIPELTGHPPAHLRPAVHGCIKVQWQQVNVHVFPQNAFESGQMLDLNTSVAFTILGSRFSTSWGWKTVMRASVLTALLLSFCPTIRVTSSGLSSKWLMSDWHSPRMAFEIKTNPVSLSKASSRVKSLQ